MTSNGNSSESSGRSSASSTGSQATVHVNLSSIGPSSYLVLPLYRRMTPEEDLISTLQGINLLVSQRQELVNQLTKHYRSLQRSNEIESLFKFSQKIDSIMRIRGIPVMPSPVLGVKTMSGGRQQGQQPLQQHQRVERGVTFQWQEFKPRDLEPKSGIRSLRRVLEVEDMKKFSQKIEEKV